MTPQVLVTHLLWGQKVKCHEARSSAGVGFYIPMSAGFY